MNNERRAELGAAAIRTDPDHKENDPETALSDVLADLMHWARREGVDFGQALISAEGHFAAEDEGDPDD